MRRVYGIGVDVDQAVSLPKPAKCIVTSAEKKLVDTVTAVDRECRDRHRSGRQVAYNAAPTPTAIGLAPYHDNEALITPEIQDGGRRRARGHRRRDARPCAPAKCTVAGNCADRRPAERRGAGRKTAPPGLAGRYDVEPALVPQSP